MSLQFDGVFTHNHTMPQIYDRRMKAGFTLVELLIIAALVAGLLLVFLPGLKHNREQANVPRTSIVAELQRVEKAKALFVTDRRLSDGAPVALPDLIKAGYYRPSSTDALPGIVFIPGKVGEPSTYQVTNHADH